MQTYIVTIIYDGGMIGMREDVEFTARNYASAIAHITDNYPNTRYGIERLVLKLTVPKHLRYRNRAAA